jgi:hypothetical protein
MEPQNFVNVVANIVAGEKVVGKTAVLWENGGQWNLLILTTCKAGCSCAQIHLK